MPNKREKVIALLVSSSLTQQKIADEVGVHPSTISNWKNEPEFRAMKKEAEWRYLGDLRSKALRTLAESLDSDNENIRLQAARDILDRAGFKPADKQEIVGTFDIQGAAEKYKKYLTEAKHDSS